MQYFSVTNCTSLDFCLQKTCNLPLKLKFFNIAVQLGGNLETSPGSFTCECFKNMKRKIMFSSAASKYKPESYCFKKQATCGFGKTTRN